MPGGEPGIPRDRVVAVVMTLADGREQFGSGYLVGGRLVLTAEHCTRDKRDGAPARGLRVIRASDWAIGDVVETVASPALDVAVLRITDTAHWAADMRAPIYARVDRSRSGMLVDCEAIGYPMLQRDPEKKTRDTAELHGTIYQTDEAESGRLLMREPLIRPGPVIDPDADSDASASPWGGLSGALVSYRGLAIGIVVEHHPRQGDSSLRALAFDKIARDSATDPMTQRVATALGLPAEEALPWAAPRGAAAGGVGDVTAPPSYRVLQGSTLPVPVDVAAKDPRPIFRDVAADAFTGREWLADKVDQFLVDNSCGYVFIEAGAGMGKTAFAAWLVKTRGYLSHFSRYSGGRSTRGALQNLSAQLIREFALNDQAPDGMLPEWAQTPAGFESLLSTAAGRAGTREKPLVLVVDGLDEAEPTGDGLPFGLPSLLPDNAYVIATYRKGLSFERPEAPVLPLRIDEDSEHNRADIRAFLTKAVRDQGLAAKLTEAHVDTADFVGLLAERSGGVWVYLRYVLEELRLDSWRPDAVGDLPPGLQAYYSEQIRRWQRDPSWDNLLRPLVATLGAVGEPLPAATLGRLSGDLDEAAVKRCCDLTFRPLLTATRGAAARTPLRYAIYHASFREVIEGELPSASGAEQSDYVIALADELQQATMEAHRRIAQTYLADFGGLGAGLPILATNSSVADVDGSYPLRQLARHLQHAERAADLHLLLAVEHPVSGDGAVNVWFAAQDHADSVMSYLDDLARADGDSTAATDVALTRNQPAAALGTEIRYALMAASVASRTASISADLLEQLIRTGVWSPGRAIDHSRRLTDPRSRVDALIVVHRHVSADQQLEVMAEAMAAATAITDEGSRARALADLAPHLPPGLLAQALTAATAIADEGSRAWALADLAPHLPPDLLPRAFAVTDEGTLAWMLAAKAAELPSDLLPYALTAATSIADEGTRVWVLVGLMPALPPDLLAQALTSAAAMTDEGARTWALVSLMPALPPHLLAQALTSAAAMTDEGSRAWVLLGLTAAPDLAPDLLAQALTMATTITDDWLRARAMVILAPYLPEDQRVDVASQALAAACAFSDQDSRDDALGNLVPNLPADLPPDLVAQALAAATAIADDSFRAQALTSLAPRLPEAQRPDVLAQALAAAAAITDDSSRETALTGLAPYLPPDLVARALAAATAITSDSSRESALISLAPRLTPDLLAQALAAATAITSHSSAETALAAIAPRLTPDLLAQALAAATAITGDGSRADALARLAPYLTPGLLAQAVAAATAIADDSSRAQALTSLAPRLPENQQPDVLVQALAAATAIPSDGSRTVALVGLAACLRDGPWDDLLAQTLAAASAATDPAHRARWLSGLALVLPEDQRADVFAQAVAAANAIPNEFYRLFEVTRLIRLLPHQLLLPQILTAATAFTDETIRAAILAVIGAHLPPDVLAQAVTAALAMKADSHRIQALTGLAPQLPPDLLTQALAAATAFTDDNSRIEALIGLAPSLAPDLLARALGTAIATADHVQQSGKAPTGPSNTPTGRPGRTKAEEAELEKLQRELELQQQEIERLSTGLADRYRVRALTGLAPHLTPDLLAQALAAAAAIVDDSSRETALTSLAPYLPQEQRPDVFAWALAAATAITDDSARAQALTSLAPHLPEQQQPDVLAQALTAATAITDDSARETALASLAPYLPDEQQPGVLAQALAAATAITDDSARAQALTSLAPHLPEQQQPGVLAQALAAATAITDDSACADTLAKLAPHLSPGLLAQALAIAIAITSDGSRESALVSLAPHLTPDLLAQALAAAIAITRHSSTETALAAIAPRLTPDLLAQALTAATAITDDSSRADALARLAPHLSPGLLAQAVAAACAITSDSSRARALTSLAPHLPEEQRPDVLVQALAAAIAITDDSSRAQALTGLAPHLTPALLGQALAATPKKNIETMTAVLEKGRSVLPPQALVDLLRHSLDSTGRDACLTVIAALAPTIAAIGGTDAIHECIKAIADVHRWWP